MQTPVSLLCKQAAAQETGELQVHSLDIAGRFDAHMEDCVILILAEEGVISGSVLKGFSQAHLSGLPQGCHFIVVHSLG